MTHDPWYTQTYETDGGARDVMDTLEKAPSTGADWQESVILTEMLADMEPAKIEDLREACHESFAAWMDEALGTGDLEDVA